MLEDLHWAEEPTLLLLKFAVEQLHGPRVLLVGTYRDTDLEARAGAARLIGSLQRAGKQLQLKLVHASEVVSLLEAETSLEVTENLVARVLHWTGGNLLFVRELIPRLEQPDDGQDFWQANIPAGIREAIRAQLGPLQEEQRTVLTTSALLGDDFEFALLARVVTLPRDDVQRSLRDAVARRALTQIAPGKYRFAHALIPRGAHERPLGHRSSRSPSSHRARSRDFERHRSRLRRRSPSTSSKPCRCSQARREPIRYALAAARTEMARHAYEQARDHCLGALSLANDRGSSVEERGQILLQLGEAQRYSGAIDEAKSTFCALAELGRSAKAPEVRRRGSARLRAHAPGSRASSDQRLVKLLEEALETLQGGGDDLRAELLAMLARALLFDAVGSRARACV